MIDNNLFNPEITEQMPNKVLPDNIAKITVIGVGGGGGNMVDHMIKEGIYKVNLIVANTDLKALRGSQAPKKIQLGLELTNGNGAGGKPEIGRDSAIESYEEIKEALKNSNIVFIATGLGGGTGTGAVSIVAKAAKDVGALTVAVVTKPFIWEGKRKIGLANLGLEELKKITDSIIIVKNDKLKEIIDQKTGMKDTVNIYDQLILLKGQFSTIEDDRKLGFIKTDDYLIQKRRIAKSITDFVNDLDTKIFEAFKKKEIEIKASLRELIVIDDKRKKYEYDVFISFSNKNKDEVEKIVNFLRGYGLRVFIYYETIAPNAGENFWVKINKALENSRHFVLVATPDAMNSDTVRTERDTFYGVIHKKDPKNRRDSAYD